jgi:hypothetical protein
MKDPEWFMHLALSVVCPTAQMCKSAAVALVLLSIVGSVMKTISGNRRRNGFPFVSGMKIHPNLVLAPGYPRNRAVGKVAKTVTNIK